MSQTPAPPVNHDDAPRDPAGADVAATQGNGPPGGSTPSAPPRDSAGQAAAAPPPRDPREGDRAFAERVLADAAARWDVASVIGRDHRRLWYFCAQWYFRLLFMLFLKGRIFGLQNVPRTGGALLVSNHQSYFDPILAALALPRESSHMARDTLFRNRFFRRMIVMCNAFPVRRAAADLGAMKESIRRIKNGGVMIVYPEGTRTRDGSIGRMHGGVVLIARRAKAPIVPTMVLGAYKVWPRDRRWPRPSRVTVAFGEPIPADQIARMSDDECIAVVRERIVEMMKQHTLHHSA